MKNNKILIAILFVAFALPIPLSLLSWFGSIISIAGLSMVTWSNFDECIGTIVALITMLLAGTYLISYAISLRITLKNKGLSAVSFLPLFHVALFGVFFAAWM